MGLKPREDGWGFATPVAETPPAPPKKPELPTCVRCHLPIMIHDAVVIRKGMVFEVLHPLERTSKVLKTPVTEEYVHVMCWEK